METSDTDKIHARFFYATLIAVTLLFFFMQFSVSW